MLPTSFYIKTPTAALDIVAVNLRYMAEHLLIGGIGVMAIYAIARLAAGGGWGNVREELRARWGLHAGLVSVLVYGASMATVHMMFAFRHFMPYLGATALTLAHISPGAADRKSPQHALIRDPYAAAARRAAHSFVHALHAEAMYRRSLQGLGTIGEYGEQGTAGYTRDFVPAMMKECCGHQGALVGDEQGTSPRIWTFAAGALPYAYREAYIFEGSSRSATDARRGGREPA